MSKAFGAGLDQFNLIDIAGVFRRNEIEPITEIRSNIILAFENRISVQMRPLPIQPDQN